MTHHEERGAEVFVIDAGDCNTGDHAVLEVFAGTAAAADERAAALDRPGGGAYASPFTMTGAGSGEWTSGSRRIYGFPVWTITRRDERVDVYLGTKWLTARGADDRVFLREFAVALLAAAADPLPEAQAPGG